MRKFEMIYINLFVMIYVVDFGNGRNRSDSITSSLSPGGRANRSDSISSVPVTFSTLNLQKGCKMSPKCKSKYEDRLNLELGF